MNRKLRFLATVLVPISIGFGLSVKSCLAWSAPTTDLSIEITSTKRGGEAKQDAFDQATEEATRRLTEDFLGPEKTAQDWNQIKQKVLKHTTRYVLFIKGSTPVEVEGGTKIMVQMRLSPDNLEAVLREARLLGQQSVRLMPLIQVTETRGSQFRWWSAFDGESSVTLAENYFGYLMQPLIAQGKSKGIFVLDPTSAGYRASVPMSYRALDLRREDQMSFAQYMKADAVVSGSVDLIRSSENQELRLDFKLQLWQSKMGRMITEINRSERVPSDAPKAVKGVIEQAGAKIFEELATKLSEAAAGGGLNSNTIRLSVLGSLNQRQLNDLKKSLSEVKGIRVLRERLFEPSRVTFEAESPLTGVELGKSLRATRIPAFNIEIEKAQDDSLVLTVRPLSSALVQ